MPRCRPPPRRSRRRSQVLPVGPARRRHRRDLRQGDRRAQRPAPGHELPRVPAAHGRRVHALLQQGARAAPRLEAKLRAEKKTDKEVADAVAAAIKAGTLKAPANGMMSYRGYDKRDRIQNLWVMSLPNATPEIAGVSTTSQRDAALEGKGLPWMMLPGTPGAHVMIPINPPVKNTTITDVAADPIAQATLPLPEDLRAGATVYDVRQGHRRAQGPAPGHQLRRVHAEGRRRVHLVLQQGDARRAAICRRSCAPQKKTDKEIAGRGRRGDQGRHDQADAVRARSPTGSTARRIASSCCGCCRCPTPRPSRSASPTAAAATTRSSGDGRAVADAPRHARARTS